MSVERLQFVKREETIDHVVHEINKSCIYAINRILANPMGIYYFNSGDVVYAGQAKILFQSAFEKRHTFDAERDIRRGIALFYSDGEIQRFLKCVNDVKWDMETAHIPDKTEANFIVATNDEFIRHGIIIQEGGKLLEYTRYGLNVLAHANLKNVRVVYVCDLSQYEEIPLVYLILDKRLIPDSCTDEEKEALYTMINIYNSEYKSELLVIDKNRFFLSNNAVSWFRKNIELVEEQSLLGNFTKKMRNGIFDIDAYTDKLLNVEKIRADIDPYDERILTDPNRGHWDAWHDMCQWKEEPATNLFEIDASIYARDPRMDVNYDGHIGIDFGTKSTVVVYHNENLTLPMGIGNGRLDKGVTRERFENPTVMHFVNLPDFLIAYRAREGRPDTKWDDLTISHTAVDRLSASRSDEYYSFLQDIKQWAGNRSKKINIKISDDKIYTLPAFLDLTDEDINPIELYAYYIGLYINNMRKGHGIFLDYYLSFPVTYEKKIREKIRKSFERGLKKSLPVEILDDVEIMKDFKVHGDISEPAAYAACAIQEYNIEPDVDGIFYGIFDMGGGTTDFDFGLWKIVNSRRYDYSIETFSPNGDKYLGGENLLEMLAFEIFKSNQKSLLENNIQFRLAPKSREFIGSDALLADSQEAEKNMQSLKEALRPYWELKTDDYKDVLVSLEGGGKELIIKVQLVDKNGKAFPNFELFTSEEQIYDFFEEQIQIGINNFFTALTLSYDEIKDTRKNDSIYVFLAGNSCRSPIVRMLFDEAVEKCEEEIYKKENLEKKSEGIFKVYPPLGTEDSYEILKKSNPSIEGFDPERPTGKTGVAFGLIELRDGGSIKRINSLKAETEASFQYFLGWSRRNTFLPLTDVNKPMRFIGKPDYGVWYEFIDADQEDFELYYTTLPECVEGKLRINGNTGVGRHHLRIEDVRNDAAVYIRAVSPHKIEYTVSTSNDVEKDRIGKIFEKEIGDK